MGCVNLADHERPLQDRAALQDRTAALALVSLAVLFRDWFCDLDCRIRFNSLAGLLQDRDNLSPVHVNAQELSSTYVYVYEYIYDIDINVYLWWPVRLHARRTGRAGRARLRPAGAAGEVGAPGSNPRSGLTQK